MSYQNLANLFFEFEEEKVEKYKDLNIGKWSAWHIIKRPLYYDIFHRLATNSGYMESQGKAKSTATLPKHIKNLFRFFWGILKISLQRLAGKQFSSITFTVSRYKVFDKTSRKYFNVFFDSLKSRGVLNSNINIEASKGSYRTPGYSPIDFYMEDPYLLLKGMKLLFISNNQIKKSSVFFAKELTDHFQRNNFDYKVDPLLVRAAYLEFISNYYLYSFLIGLINPKVCIYIDHVGHGRMAAALNKRKRVIELQHGMFLDKKPDYIYSGKIKSIKERMIIPHRLLVFGDFFKDRLLSAGFWNPEEIVSIGNYTIQKLREEVNFSVRSGNLRVLLGTQWTLTTEIKTMLEDIINYELSGIKIVIKPHPKETSEGLTWYENFCIQHSDNFEYVPAHSDIADHYKTSHVFLSHFSTTMFEAISAGVPCISLVSKALPNGIYSAITAPELEPIIPVAENTSLLVKMLNELQTNENKRQEWARESRHFSAYIYADNYEERYAKVVNEQLRFKL